MRKDSKITEEQLKGRHKDPRAPRRMKRSLNDEISKTS